MRMILILLFFITPSASSAAWFFSTAMIPSPTKEYQIDDSGFSFDLKIPGGGSYKCSVSKTEIYKYDDFSYAESRRLSCDLNDGAVVIISANCRQDEYTVTTFGFQKDGKGNAPFLMCGKLK